MPALTRATEEIEFFIFSFLVAKAGYIIHERPDLAGGFARPLSLGAWMQNQRRTASLHLSKRLMKIVACQLFRTLAIIPVFGGLDGVTADDLR